MADFLPQPTPLRAFAFALLLLAAATRLPAQESDPRAVAAVRAAVESQLEADRNDHFNWIYRDHDNTPGKDAIYVCAGSPRGELRRMVELNGHTLTDAQAQAENDRIAKFVHDTSEQAKAKKADAHDDAQATELLKMLPESFVWTIASETPTLMTLNYRPNPKFEGPDMQSRVMSTMAGQMVIAVSGNTHRIRTFKGSLTDDFRIGFGILGKLYKGGTFDVERREVGPGIWQITETHVHIGGHALFFKTIGTQQDEVKTDWKPSPAKSLEDAEELLRKAK